MAFKIVEMAPGGTQQLASSQLADEACLARDFVAGNILPVARGVRPFDRQPVHLRQQNVGQGPSTGSGAPSSKSEIRTSNFPLRSRMVLLMFAKE